MSIIDYIIKNIDPNYNKTEYATLYQFKVENDVSGNKYTFNCFYDTDKNFKILFNNSCSPIFSKTIEPEKIQDMIEFCKKYLVDYINLI